MIIKRCFYFHFLNWVIQSINSHSFIFGLYDISLSCFDNRSNAFHIHLRHCVFISILIIFPYIYFRCRRMPRIHAPSEQRVSSDPVAAHVRRTCRVTYGRDLRLVAMRLRFSLSITSPVWLLLLIRRLSVIRSTSSQMED